MFSRYTAQNSTRKQAYLLSLFSGFINPSNLFNFPQHFQVEHRCRQYHHQMQIVVASFEQVAGIGSAKSYTQLALKTILKQFRCLKAKISAQIKALNKSLGEEESFGDKFEGSRLKYVDHQLRQQRALQQLGMVQNSAWRPQRGLPERAVSVLRAWLFEHFLHP